MQVAGLHLNGQTTMDMAGADPRVELEAILARRPVSISSDHPRRLLRLLAEIGGGRASL